MAAKILSLMLVLTQLMSWAAEPLHLCISKNGTVSVEFDEDHCRRCVALPESPSCEQPACCSHCDSEQKNDHAVAVLTDPCDCTHIPLMFEQRDSIRSADAGRTVFCNVPILWLQTSHLVVPRTFPTLVLHWDRRNDPSRHPVSLTTTVMRC